MKKFSYILILLTTNASASATLTLQSFLNPHYVLNTIE